MYQIWIQNDYLEFEKIGPTQSDVDGNLWLQVLGKHFGCEVRLRPVPPKPVQPATVSPRSVWPGE